ncbi:MAG: hypothetical protein EBR28_11610 [Planctomycetia bacterium]|nr:hypothetical protein [Planctomycetia bacterium]
MLLGTLLRRAGRLREARDALDKLSRSDAGAPWRSVIARELDRIAAAEASPPAADDVAPAVILPLAAGGQVTSGEQRAA